MITNNKLLTQEIFKPELAQYQTKIYNQEAPNEYGIQEPSYTDATAILAIYEAPQQITKTANHTNIQKNKIIAYACEELLKIDDIILYLDRPHRVINVYNRPDYAQYTAVHEVE